MDKKTKIAVIGAGLRSKTVLPHLFRESAGAVEIAAIYDPDTAVAEDLLRELKQPLLTPAASADEAIQTPGVEWVMIFSPNAFHREHILKSFAAGKHVFAEKPLATTVADCQMIYKAHQKSGKIFATGFVLRYAPIYCKVKQLLDSGLFGKIMSMEANENIPPEHGGYIMANWRRHRALAGPHILEKCCHDLNLIEWFTRSLPGKVAATADRKFFTPEHAELMRHYPPETFQAWPDPHRIASPFTGDTDLDDMIFSIAEFRNGIRVAFSATMANAIPERRMRIHCEYGTLLVELYTMTIRYKLLGREDEHVIRTPGGSGHGGGDSRIMRELLDTMQNHTPPKCSGSDGLTSAVYALALDQAAREHKVIDLEPTWATLGR